ncbi:ribonuclease T2 [Conidiobolus coronatus NRRL 28638]|uniref:ribonuclease T2 n=1 Tax=Conidiobolus coronatus (strain ATCC 28846 / CBS 209.66 / NRRL 28638) TaxID=796925 RepID=A0A137P937_CONC2|nr:ribonuclease T2 [Conidiobolus coronatus NRRL 28638]|eukprot:KXN71527.1 ribonuclease T2 [Conidiobolus coronatus NRRL 28638]
MGIVVLALQWLTSTGPKDAWTLHGLWPDNCDGTQGPRNGCDRTRNYNDMREIISKDPKLWDQMNTYFSSFKGDNPSFWTHEWTKHGTCVSTLQPDCYDNYEPKQEVRDFFNKTLELRQRFDLFPVLQEGNLKPGRLYSRNQWLEALQPVFGKSVVLRCRGNMIQEVHIFLQVYGKDRYELTGALSHSNCPTRINYPAKNL